MSNGFESRFPAETCMLSLVQQVGKERALHINRLLAHQVNGVHAFADERAECGIEYHGEKTRLS